MINTAAGAPTDPARQLAAVERWLQALDQHGLVSQALGETLRNTIMQSRAERLDIQDDPLLVTMLCGPTAVGKSSLINTLAGHQIARSGTGATTSAALIYVHDCDDPGRLFEYGEALGQLGRDGASIVRHNRDELLHKILVDTPDIDSVVAQHRELTAALVHCADIVLFVTSPEKYKNLQSARWVAQQREQRAVGFVLNKWDRASIGIQYNQRGDAERDFRAILAAEGFADPIIFKTTTLPASEAGDDENEAPLLGKWLAEALDSDARESIQDKRRRSAWGRLGAAIAPVAAELAIEHPYAGQIAGRLEETKVQAFILSQRDAMTLTSAVRYVRTPLLNRAMREPWQRISGTSTKLTSRFGWILAVPRAVGRLESAEKSPASAGSCGAAPEGFGHSPERLAADTVSELTHRAAVARLPLGNVPASWRETVADFDQQYRLLPGSVEGELLVEANRRSFRRLIGSATLLVLDAALTITLIAAFVRLAWGFITGNLVQGGVLLDGLALVGVFVLLSQLAKGGFFPPLQDRLRQVTGSRARKLVQNTWDKLLDSFTEQQKAAAELKDESARILSGIDQILLPHTPPRHVGKPVVDRLFGKKNSCPADASSSRQEEIEKLDPAKGRRSPIFD